MKKIRISCPFGVYGKITCVYMVPALTEGFMGYCDDIDCCPGNSDAFCGGIIQTALQSKESRKPVRRKAPVQQLKREIAAIAVDFSQLRHRLRQLSRD
jgi:hypothetical protein